MKRGEPNAGRLQRLPAESTLDAQLLGLRLLRAAGADHFVAEGMLFTRRAAGTPMGRLGWLRPSYCYAGGSWRLGTPVNDLRTGNLMRSGVSFDPALDPLMRWTTAYAGGAAFEDGPREWQWAWPPVGWSGPPPRIAGRDLDARSIAATPVPRAPARACAPLTAVRAGSRTGVN